MTLSLATKRCFTAKYHLVLLPKTYHGIQSISTTATVAETKRPARTQDSAMSRLPTKTLLRSLALTSLMSSRWLLRPSVTVMGLIANSKSPIFNPDRNPVINRLLRWTVYDHFCAGTNPQEVRKSVAEFKRLGYQGVILTHAKEVVLDEPRIPQPKAKEAQINAESVPPQHLEAVEKWKQHSLSTLQMLEPGDFLALKLTGAGPLAVHALRTQSSIPPHPVAAALHAICAATTARGCRLWLDGEQQALQRGVDAWALGLMRRWNADGRARVYTTTQAYLKGARASVERQVALAAREGWALGVKLVRGAYIEHEVRGLIHDSKGETDAAYDGIAAGLIEGAVQEAAGGRGVREPLVALFLATHNRESVRKACEAQRERVQRGLPVIRLECGQIVGMADELGCELVQRYEQCLADKDGVKAGVPKAFKCLTWGSVGDCVGYLHRRAIENRGAVERTRHMADALGKELRRRVFAA